jgi:hypothetical protein
VTSPWTWERWESGLALALVSGAGAVSRRILAAMVLGICAR